MVVHMRRSVADQEVLLISAMTGEGLSELTQVIMQHVRKRRAEMIEAGEEVTILRQTDLDSEVAAGKKRVPPHLAGPTANLSNELQAKDYESVSDLDPDGKPTGKSS